MMTFNIQKVSGQMQYDIIIFCKKIFWPLFSATTLEQNSEPTHDLVLFFYLFVLNIL